jgi:iron(III) transport system permease protein
MSAVLHWRLLANSLLVAGGATALAMFFGFALALVAVAAPAFGRKLLVACSIVVLALPAFLVTNCWIDLLGTAGKLHAFLPVKIFSLAGAIWVLGLMLWPIPALAIYAAWQKLEPVHFEVDPALRGPVLLKYLLWPAARPLAFTAAAVVFALALNNFAVPAILQVKTFPAEVWVQFNTNLDPVAALALSWPMIIVPIALLLFLRRPQFPWPRETGGDFADALRRQLSAAWLAFAALIAGGAIALGLSVPLLQLTATPQTWNEFVPALTAGIPALTNSVIYAVSAAALSVTIGLSLARVRALGWMWLLFLLPGVLLGIGALTAFRHPSLHWFSRTAAIVVALLVMRYLALARSINRSALRSIDTTPVDSGRLDGAAGMSLFRRVVFPQIAPQIGAAAYVVYLLCLWDVETILLVIPPGGETLALRIFNLLHYGHNAHVNALCLLLLLLALAPFVLFALWQWIEARKLNAALAGRSAHFSPLQPSSGETIQ